VRKKKITDKNTEEFKYLLCNKLWEDIFLCDDVNTSFDAYLIMFVYYFRRAFFSKTIYVKDQYQHKWITQDLKVGSKRM